ncbi:MAG: phosphotransferase [Chitinophagaceae bacterium]|nr:phosphotransferase [Chitinophagaceae bacterium]
MQDHLGSISLLFEKWAGKKPSSIDVLPQSGSERRYFRIFSDNESVIATYGENIKENETFIYFSKHFREKGLTVPEIFLSSKDGVYYLQQDFGNISLLNLLENEGHSENVYTLFQKSLKSLALLQVKGDEGLDYNKCLTSSEFGKQAIMADLLYFKYYFLDALRKPYDKQKLIDDFETLSNYITDIDHKYFMFRDFQSRNIMVSDNGVHFIDYQGGMKGAPQYDVASLLWQAKADLPDNWKSGLLEEYIDYFEEATEQKVNRDVFRNQYKGYVLIRLLQVLGAYGFRGLFERKAHFLTSIPMALRNLGSFLNSNEFNINTPELQEVLDLCTSDEIVQKFTPVRATEETPLIVKISSFSYRNSGIPADNTDNGGGFVFDCRGILNPGRVETMKTQTGRDKEVKEYLEQQTQMPDFLNSVFDMVDITVEEYINRGFESLMISFGCTGGQHRSVYAADAMTRHLRNKFNVKVELKHIEQEKKNWYNPLPEKKK